MSDDLVLKYAKEIIKGRMQTDRERSLVDEIFNLANYAIKLSDQVAELRKMLDAERGRLW